MMMNAVELVMAVTGQSKERAEKTLADRPQLMAIDDAIDLVMSLRAPMKTRMRHCDILRRAKQDRCEKTTSLVLANIGTAIGWCSKRHPR